MNKTVFYQNLSLNENKLEIFNQAIQDGKITHFDQATITRLRRLYYGLYTGLIFIYKDPTSFHNIGDKVELLTHVFEDKEYKLYHGETDSTRDIPFFQYGVEHLDFNSWIEIEEGNKVWVYDLFSLLKIEKEVYYKLENPKVKKIIPKETIMNHPGRERDDYTVYHDGFNEMLVGIFAQMEQNMDTHPFKNILAPEITRFKKEINFDEIELRWNKEVIEHKKKS